MVGSAVIKQGRSANRKHTYFFFWPKMAYAPLDMSGPIKYVHLTAFK